MNLRNLRTLNISRHCLADRETDSFMDFEEILPMLCRIPRIEQVRIPTIGFSKLGDRKALEIYCKKHGIDCDWAC